MISGLKFAKVKAKIQKSSEWFENFVSGNNPIYEVTTLEQLLFLIRKYKLPLLIKEPADKNISDIDIELFDEYRL